MTRITDTVSQILDEKQGYSMRHERRVSDEEKTVHKYIDKVSIQQLEIIEKKIAQRKERLTYLQEQSERKGV